MSTTTLTLPEPILPDDSRETVIEKRDRMDAIKRAVREHDQLMKDSALEYLEMHGAFEYETIDGPRRIYVGKVKTRKVRPDMACELLGMIHQFAAGDVELTNGCFKSDAFSLTGIRKVLGEDADEYIEEKESLDVKTGAPKKAVKDAKVEDLERVRGGAS